MVTTRSKSSESTRVSMGRCVKERMLSRPVVMTEPDSIEVTRVSGRKTRLRGPTSTDESDDVGLGFQPKDDNDVVNLADLVAQRVENTGARELSDVHAPTLGA